jgi:hypothetical protein
LKLTPQAKLAKSQSNSNVAAAATATSAAAGGPSSYLLNTYYTLADFIKVPEAVDILSIEQDMKKKRESIARIQERTKILNVSFNI